MQLPVLHTRNIKKRIEKSSNKTNENLWEEEQMNQSRRATNKEKAYPLGQLF